MTREEAIEVYNGLINNKIKEAFEFFAPELAESEDERIRKSIIHILQVGGYMSPEEKDKAFAYLEKQKEHSMSAEEVLVRAGLKPYKDGNQWCILAGDNIQEGICGFGDTIDEALYQFLMEVLEKQKEPIDPFDTKLFQDGVKEGRRLEREDIMKEQKPIEPSDDELQRHQDELYNFKVFAAKQAKEYHISYVHDFEWNNFCAEILSYFNEQKPAEWNDEDERMLSRCVKSIESSKQFADADIFKKAKDKEIDWLKNKLKSLRPQSRKELSIEKAIQ